MKVVINPTPDERGAGSTASISWNSPAMERHLRNLFGLLKEERIRQLEVDQEGITCRIGTENGSNDG